VLFARIFVTSLFIITTASAQPMKGRVDVPVMVGGEPDMDACPSGGTVTGLDPRGDGFLSVRSGPGGAKFREMTACTMACGLQFATRSDLGSLLSTQPTIVLSVTFPLHGQGSKHTPDLAATGGFTPGILET